MFWFKFIIGNVFVVVLLGLIILVVVVILVSYMWFGILDDGVKLVDFI